jgi:hypothetical protein
MKRYKSLIPLLLIVVAIYNQGCDSCADLKKIDYTFYLEFNPDDHPSREDGSSFLSSHCNLELGPVQACGPAFDNTFNTSMLGDDFYRDYHLLRVYFSPKCDDMAPVEIFFSIPINAQYIYDCYSFKATFPEGIEVGVDVEYIEACNDCYNNARNNCGAYYRSHWYGSSSAIATTNGTNSSIFPVKFIGGYCSGSDNCENYIYKDAILIQ